MTRSAVQHGVMNAPRGNQKVVFIAVAGTLASAALPFISKQASPYRRSFCHWVFQWLVVCGPVALSCHEMPELQVRKREQEVANMRDASYDAKDAARNARLRVK